MNGCMSYECSAEGTYTQDIHLTHSHASEEKIKMEIVAKIAKTGQSRAKSKS